MNVVFAVVLPPVPERATVYEPALVPGFVCVVEPGEPLLPPQPVRAPKTTRNSKLHKADLLNFFLKRFLRRMPYGNNSTEARKTPLPAFHNPGARAGITSALLLAAVVVMVAVMVALVALAESVALPVLLKAQVGGLLAVPVPV